MAQKRMFAMTIVDSDAFLNMPVSAQNLYFALGMRADDEGFINGPEKIVRICKAKKSDLELLEQLKFVIKFDTGIICIKHWLINNYIADKRLKPTVYQDEKKQLAIKSNKAYTKRIQNADKSDVSIDQLRLDENRIDEYSSEEEPPAAEIDEETLRRRMIEINKKPFNQPLTPEEIEVVRQYDQMQKRGSHE